MSTPLIQIFFARPPVMGKVKTRLGNFIGMENSCLLYQKILSNTLADFSQRNLDLYLFSSEKMNIKLLEDMTVHLRLKTSVQLQKGNNLSERMQDALYQVAKKFHDDSPILLAGTDIPSYNTKIAYQAVEKLQLHPAVLGPSDDGGYYLIGLQASLCKDKKLLRNIFRAMSWSHEKVFQKQKSKLENLGFRVATLPKLRDIDTFEDLASYQNERKGKRQLVTKSSRTRYSHQTSLDLSEFYPDIRVILPVYNEAENLPLILKALLGKGYFTEVICADNGSIDGSPRIAERLGARVTHCQKKGYGSTCLKAIDDIRKRGGCDVVLFTDADGSDSMKDLEGILSPTVSGRTDLCLGMRSSKLAEKDALFWHARLGNLLAVSLIRLFWKGCFRDLGPFRSVRWSSLEKMEMSDPDFGWTIQMQIRAIKKSLRIQEIPVKYQKRKKGKSKISGSITGSFLAGWIILRTIYRELRSDS